ncbi:sirohydrochlorin chelatase [Amycolatopsis cihanbeyliensis]|uniref:Cobalamin biosynthesis protein CbiX n=1 Tax=Amycolatopsis cihanbeyliensis TaxID=1128664 RepID=A0A542DC82_AMYCI|nr:hypothetical protein [Amycolatopsis cihanbeyliensis]TQJ00665.1 hypothetical protein FB471_0307 [Amycolatopsis cihanbeyliensis]
MPATLLLTGGHESDSGRALAPLALPGGTAHRVIPPGRPLQRAASEALEDAPHTVCVVPMTLGRDPKLVADTARALNWLTRGAGRGRICLTAPFGTTDHLIGWLRAAARHAAGPAPDVAVLITAPVAGPFEDAELFRVARLVRQYSGHRWVEVAFAGGDPDLAEGVDRCHRLGATRVALVPASFCRATVRGSEGGGPLLTEAAIAGVLTARTTAATRALACGDDGILAGLDAEHGHGYAHSHGPGDERHVHGHVHSHR